jgi:alginate O-acetyltransferase complex protein AlgI
MVFSSITFIFYFLPVFLAFYYLSGTRNATLLVGSAIFYTWGEGAFVALLLSLIGLNLWAGGIVARAKMNGNIYL